MHYLRVVDPDDDAPRLVHVRNITLGRAASKTLAALCGAVPRRFWYQLERQVTCVRCSELWARMQRMPQALAITAGKSGDEP